MKRNLFCMMGALTVLLALSLALAGCGSLAGLFEPSENLVETEESKTLQKGAVDIVRGWGGDGPTPQEFYRAFSSKFSGLSTSSNIGDAIVGYAFSYKGKEYRIYFFNPKQVDGYVYYKESVSCKEIFPK